MDISTITSHGSRETPENVKKRNESFESRRISSQAKINEVKICHPAVNNFLRQTDPEDIKHSRNGSIIINRPSSVISNTKTPETKTDKSMLCLDVRLCWNRNGNKKTEKKEDGEIDEEWQPWFWTKVCPSPFCPTYRQFARSLAFILLGLIVWGLAYTILKETAAPGGQLFSLALLCVSAYLGGQLISIVAMPSLVGMLFVGILFKNVDIISFNDDYLKVCNILRKQALVIIMLRAGLDLDPRAMKRLYRSIIQLGLFPWLIEMTVIAVFSYFIFDLSWRWSFMLGSMIAAVAPAIIVVCLFRLRQQGYCPTKGIPTLLIAVAGIDDAASVATFGIISSTFLAKDLVYTILQGPLSIALGIGFGVLWGHSLNYIPERKDPYSVPMRIVLLLFGGQISVFGSEALNLTGAGPLGCIVAAFVANYCWTKSDKEWNVENNAVATSLEILWVAFEPIVFGITGTAVEFKKLNGNTVFIGIGCILLGVLIRFGATVLFSAKAQLNFKEKIFIALAWLAKAIVPAALGPTTIELAQSTGNADDMKNAEIVQLVAIIAIILCAPAGAISMILSGRRLLRKTNDQLKIRGTWRRTSQRPSIYDIEVDNDEEEKDDDEDSNQQANTTV